MRCASVTCWRSKTEMLPLFGPVLVSLQDPLLLRWHARWTGVMLMRRLRAVRMASRRASR